MTDDPSPLATILVHHKENARKCTLEPLRGHRRLRFIGFAPDTRYGVSDHLVLEIGAPPLSPADAGRPLLILDATWRLLPALRRSIEGDFISRSLPAGLETAYPRRSRLEPDPDHGLASVEALFAALCVLGHRDDSLLEGFRWREEFLRNCRAAKII